MKFWKLPAIYIQNLENFRTFLSKEKKTYTTLVSAFFNFWGLPTDSSAPLPSVLYPMVFPAITQDSVIDTTAKKKWIFYTEEVAQLSQSIMVTIGQLHIASRKIKR